MVVAAFDDRFDDPAEVGAAIDDGRGDPAVFQRRTRTVCELGVQRPPYPGRADEAQEGHPLVGGQRLGQVVALRQEALAPRLGQPGFVHHRDEFQARQWRRGGRFDDHRAPDGDGRRHLVDDQVQWVVERRDRGNHADRLPRGERPTPLRRGRQPHRDFATGEVAQLVGGVVDTVDGACGFDDGVRQRLAALPGNLQREMITPGVHQRGEPAQDRDALVRREPAVAVLEYPLGGTELALQGRGGIQPDLGDGGTVERLDDSQHVGFLAQHQG